MNKQQTERIYDNDPTPAEALEYISDAISALRTERWSDADSGYIGGGPLPVERSITLADIQLAVAKIMADKDEVFSSFYRHGNTPLHSVVYHVLGSTVGMNHLIWRIRRDAEETKKAKEAKD